MNVSRRHPSYERDREEATFLGLSYVGGPDYRDAGYLDRYVREEPEVYEARKAAAYYANYTAAVVDSYVAEVFRVAPVRELGGEAAQEFARDATGDGTTLTEFMRLSLISALAIRVRYIVVDLDETGRPYVHAIHPANLLDYSEARGGYNWILVAEEVVEDADPERPRQSTTRYRLWTPEEWRLYSKNGDQIDAGPNRAGVVPLVVMRGDDARLPIWDIAEMNRRIYNICSQRDEILRQQTFSQFYAQDSIDEETGSEQQVVELGIRRALIIPPGSTITPGFITPPDGPVEQHRKEQEYLVGEIYRLAGLERRDPDSQRPQSGVAKAYDFRETNARLANAAAMCQRAEEEIFELLSRYGLTNSYNITYQKDFNVEAFETQLDNYLKLSEAPLPAGVKRMAAKDLAGRIAEERSQQEREEAARLVDEMPDTDFPTAAASPIERLLS